MIFSFHIRIHGKAGDLESAKCSRRNCPGFSINRPALWNGLQIPPEHCQGLTLPGIQEKFTTALTWASWKYEIVWMHVSRIVSRPETLFWCAKFLKLLNSERALASAEIKHPGNFSFTHLLVMPLLCKSANHMPGKRPGDANSPRETIRHPLALALSFGLSNGDYLLATKKSYHFT